MRDMLRRLSVLVWAVTLTVLAPPASADPDSFSFQGSFQHDDDVQLFAFHLASDSSVLIRTWSYAGGVNAAGDTISRGGFDPMLFVFDSTGLLTAEALDGVCDSEVARDLSGACFDAYLTNYLSAGEYTLALTQYDNFPVDFTLAGGFTRTGQPAFTGDLTGNPGESFWDITPDHRTSGWAVDISGADGAHPVDSVPEPTSLQLLTLALLTVAFGARIHLARGLTRGSKRRHRITRPLAGIESLLS